MNSSMYVFAIEGIGEVRSGDDIADLIMACSPDLISGDVLVITSKIVSKSEGRVMPASSRDSAIEQETVRVVATRTRNGHTTRIVENRLGIVSAAAGVDTSNTPDGHVLLLPVDPDASARRIAQKLRANIGVSVGIIISDTCGRPWRDGQTDIAIGAAGVTLFADMSGLLDSGGKLLVATKPCVADELAAAADLVKGKTEARPVAVIRGRGDLVGDLNLPGASHIVRHREDDMFFLGAREALDQGFREGWEAARRSPTDSARER